MDKIKTTNSEFYLFCSEPDKIFKIDENWKISNESLDFDISLLEQLNTLNTEETHLEIEENRYFVYAGLAEISNIKGKILLEFKIGDDLTWLKDFSKKIAPLVNTSEISRNNPKIHDYEFLLNTASSIISKLSLEQVLQEMLDGAIQILNSERGSLMLINENNSEELLMKVAKGIPKDIIPTIKIKVGEGISGSVAKTGNPILIKDIENHDKFKKKSSSTYTTTSLLSVPLKFRDKIIGVFNINNKKDGLVYNEGDLKLLMGLANQATVAINNAKQFENLIKKQDELDAQIDAYSNLYEEQFALYEIIRVFRHSYDVPTEPRDKMVVMAMDTVTAKVGLLIMADEDKYKVAFAKGLKSEDFRPTTLEGEDHLIAKVIEKKYSLIINNFNEDISISPEEFQLKEVFCDDFLNELKFLIDDGLNNCVILPLYDYENNSKLGALIIANRGSGEDFTEHYRNLLDTICNQISAQVTQTQLLSQYIQKKSMEKELDVAKTIQEKLLPKVLPNIPNVDIHAYNKPAKHVSGDYYDFLEHSKDYKNIGLVIADVAGKGIPAALIMSMTRAILRTHVTEDSTPARILNRSNKFLNEDIESNRYVTMFYSIINTENYKLKFAKAGHNPPIWYKAKDKSLEYLEIEGFPLGMFDFSFYEDDEIQMEEGDKLIFYTDGITESMNDKNEEYTLERLGKFVQDFSEFDSKSLVERLMMDVDKFSQGCLQHDDLTIIVLSISEFRYKETVINSTRDAIIEFTEKFIQEIEDNKIEGIDQFELTMILDELLINAAEHGNKFDTEKKVHIKYALKPYKIELIVTDEGKGFDWEKTFREKEKITLYHKRGRGIQIVKKLVEILEYSNKGKTCRMVKYLK